ncbi:universal stress protein [Halobacteria archaeon AArc-m2/3/4]|uniref:Universal stress protein n=1 Tax=Natronoglomus mannanivorans TaxID=2979990 RepID=A0AAP3E0F3_9EURY|nr:universal stress protein [Halobacteria archaeon AArc-xg1-1]MCU4975591.1 universal stress protein [Halobacteria archaeon AArc-m2/3/4]
MYDCILVPTDGSTEGERAVEYAIDLALTHDATLRAIYVVNAASYGGLPMETAWDGISDALREEGQAAVDRVEELADERGVHVETAVLEGSPSRVIVGEAQPEKCDLVVMGTHGRGGIDRLLLGSVAERVVRSSPVPVLTVRVGEDEFEEATADVDAQAVVE